MCSYLFSLSDSSFSDIKKFIALLILSSQQNIYAPLALLAYLKKTVTVDSP